MNYYDFGLCAGLVDAGCRVTLLTCDETVAEHRVPFELRASFRGIYGTAPAWLRGLRFLRDATLGIVRARLEGSRVFHFHFFHVGTLELWNVLLARIAGGLVVVTAHDVEAFKEGLSVGPFPRWAYRMSAAVIAHNQVSRAELIERLKVKDEKVYVIPHGNYAGFFPQTRDRVAAREGLGLSKTGRVLLFFGQIKEVKGLDLLLNALAKVRAAVPDIHLVIAGKVWKDSFSRYQAEIDRLKLSEAVTAHIRYIPDADVDEYFAAADLVVCPYRRIYQSGVVLMAMSIGTPVLASDIPGMAEVIEDGSTGFLFRSEDIDALAEKLHEVLKDPQRMSDVAHRARELMERDYGWTRIGRLTANCYEQALGRG